jgi:sialate O-acetylesterase
MVLQRDHNINFWGIATPGEKVMVNMGDMLAAVLVDAKGEWMISLPPKKAGGPYTITVTQGNEKIEFNDVYIGDVWLCSGQSNMEWIIANSAGYEGAITESDDMIRHFKVPHIYAEQEEKTFEGGPWVVDGPERVGAFSAVGYYFAKEVRKSQDVAIGLLNSSWGGSRIEAWMSSGSLGGKRVETAITQAKAQARKNYDARLEQIKKDFPGVATTDSGMKGDVAVWADPQLQDADWKKIEVPGLWEEQGYQGFDGIAWYRHTFALSKEQVRQQVTINLGKIDDTDQVWINGHYIGGMKQAYDKMRSYQIPSTYLVDGQNTIAVRVEDTGGGGGIYGSAEDVNILIGSEMVSLAGQWNFRIGSFLPFTFNNRVHHTPTMLYNKMIYPLLNFPIKGALWYQGESNAGSAEDAYAYKDQFQNMISDWRKKWAVGDFPFLYVQLANFMAPDEEPSESNWAILRESQSAALNMKNVGEAVIIDIGEADDIHPRNKKDVGIRLSLAARKIAYEEDVLHHGPHYVRHQSKGEALEVEFDQRLIAKGESQSAEGFAIAGVDGVFQWASGKVNGNKVILQSKKIKSPVHVRYAWGNNPEKANLYNSIGLPAGPFRTDNN